MKRDITYPHLTLLLVAGSLTVGVTTQAAARAHMSGAGAQVQEHTDRLGTTAACELEGLPEDQLEYRSEDTAADRLEYGEDQFDILDDLCGYQEPEPTLQLRLPIPHVVTVFFCKLGVKLFMQYAVLRAWVVARAKMVLTSVN